MSLLIKALEQAAKDRKASRAGAETSDPAESGPQPPQPPEPREPVEPTLEPPPPRRVGVREELGASPRPAPSAAAEPPQPRRAPQSLASLAQADAQRERARAAAVMQAGSRSAGHALAWLRANPVVLVGGLAVLFGIGFGIYVYLQIAHPGVFVRQAATKPEPVPPPAPPHATAAPAPPAGLPQTGTPDAASAVPTAPAADPVLAPAGTQPVGTPASSGAFSAAPPVAPAPAPAVAATAPAGSAPLPSASILGAAAAPQAPRERAPEPAADSRRERGSIRTTDAAESAPAPRVAAPRAQGQPETPAPAGRERIAVSPTAQQPRVNPLLAQAYTLLQSGNIEEARTAYTRVSQAEPLNIDALLGLAYIAAQENRTEDATKAYLRILQLNPRHAVAQAALIGLMGRADPVASETRLKQLIAREPSAFLHFILGNVYADQALWSQAQQAYFQAHHMEPDNPDYAYNLAVGLDHLRQSKLALNFYRRAEQLATAQGRSNFNLPHARERIRILSSQVE